VKKNNKKRIIKNLICLILVFSLLFSNAITVIAEKDTEDYLTEAEARKELPIESDSIEGWPAGPRIGAESAILMEANTGTILYSKNIHEHLYPASVTKILTALIAMEECDMDEMVTFSNRAIESIDWRNDANLGINPGNSITMEQCLYGLLVGSANEVAYAIAEHICGDGNVSDFANLMNEKAKELGCIDSNFVTPNGIHDDNHYTSAYDLALIAKAFYSNELLSKMSATTSYKVPQTETQPKDDMIVYAKSKLHEGKEYAYEGLVGTKTGYTNIARQTLVSCAEKNGLKLICVIMKEESPYQYTDTIDLFNYGFDNFNAVNIAANDKTYVIQSLNFFSTSLDFFGSSKPILQVNDKDYIVLPKDADFTDTVSELKYEGINDNEIAKVDYYFNDVYLGSASIEPAETKITSFDFGPKDEEIEKEVLDEDVMIINIKMVIYIVIGVTLAILLILILRAIIIHKLNPRRRRRRRSRRRNKKRELDFRGFKG